MLTFYAAAPSILGNTFLQRAAQFLKAITFLELDKRWNFGLPVTEITRKKKGI